MGNRNIYYLSNRLVRNQRPFFMLEDSPEKGVFAHLPQVLLRLETDQNLLVVDFVPDIQLVARVLLIRFLQYLLSRELIQGLNRTDRVKNLGSSSTAQSH